MTEPNPTPSRPGIAPAKSQARQSSEARYAAWATRMKGSQESTAEANRNLAPEVEEVEVDPTKAGDVFDMDLLFTSSAQLAREADAQSQPDTTEPS